MNTVKERVKSKWTVDASNDVVPSRGKKEATDVTSLA